VPNLRFLEHNRLACCRKCLTHSSAVACGAVDNFVKISQAVANVIAVYDFVVPLEGRYEKTRVLTKPYIWLSKSYAPGLMGQIYQTDYTRVIRTLDRRAGLLQ
jgi:hypothetical protein